MLEKFPRSVASVDIVTNWMSPIMSNRLIPMERKIAECQGELKDKCFLSKAKMKAKVLLFGLGKKTGECFVEKRVGSNIIFP